MNVQTSPFITWLVSQAQETTDPAQCLEEWNRASFNRWCKLIEPLPENVGPRFNHGWYCISYEIVGTKRKIEPARFPDILKESVGCHPDWEPFLFETREGIKPYQINGSIECWLGGDTEITADQRSPSFSDFWRINLDGLAFLLRGFDEDSEKFQLQNVPARSLEVTHPVQNIGKVLLHASRLASKLFEEPTEIKLTASYYGLEGRTLISLNGTRLSPKPLVTHQNEIMLTSFIDTDTIGPNLPKIVRRFLSPLYALFNFYGLPIDHVQEGLEHIKER